MCAGVFACTHLCLYLCVSEDGLIFSRVCYTSLFPFIRQICLLSTVALILIDLNNKNLESDMGGMKTERSEK